MKIEIPARYIIEVGLCRKRNTCALCGDEMNVPNHNIQLCKKCRLVELNIFMLGKNDVKGEKDVT